MYHTRKTRKKYVQRIAPPGTCPFCEDEIVGRTIRETKNLRIVPNLTFYDHWELTDVADHLLIVPKRHLERLEEFTKEEKVELVDLMAEYEASGYNVYARGTGSPNRSVKHQHTHLIRTQGKRARASLFLKKPYLLLKIK